MAAIATLLALGFRREDLIYCLEHAQTDEAALNKVSGYLECAMNEPGVSEALDCMDDKSMFRVMHRLATDHGKRAYAHIKRFIGMRPE